MDDIVMESQESTSDASEMTKQSVNNDKDDSKESVEVIEVDDDNAIVEWKVEDVRKYLFAKTEGFIRDQKYNPLLSQIKETDELYKSTESLLASYAKLQRMYDALCKDHNIFLNRMGAESNIKYKTVGVGVDFPPLPADLPQELVCTDGEKKTSLNENKNPQAKKANGAVECIDLTSDDESSVPSKSKEKPAVSINPVKNAPAPSSNQTNHPAPLPSITVLGQKASDIPSKPILTITDDKTGIVLKWEMLPGTDESNITNFDIFCYQEKANLTISSELWQKIGCVKAMPLPMTCSLTKFVKGSRYHFAIRAITGTNIAGQFSNPVSLFWA